LEINPRPIRYLSSLVAQLVKNLPGSIPGLGRSPREGNGNPPQYSSLENPVDMVREREDRESHTTIQQAAMEVADTLPYP